MNSLALGQGCQIAKSISKPTKMHETPPSIMFNISIKPNPPVLQKVSKSGNTVVRPNRSNVVVVETGERSRDVLS